MIIHNTTILKPEEALESLKKISKRNYLTRYIYSGFLLIFGILIMIMSFTEEDFVQSITIGGVFFAIAAAFLIYNFVSIKKLPQTVAKKNPEVAEQGITNVFTFKEESLIAKCFVGGHESKFEGKYVELNKIIEEDDRILFMVNSTDVLICKKDGFKNEKEMSLFFYGLSKHKIKIKDKKRKVE